MSFEFSRYLDKITPFIPAPFVPLVVHGLPGATRGAIMHAAFYPLEIIKTHQQSAFNGEKSYQVAKRLFAQHGAGIFYVGLQKKLEVTGIKHFVNWNLVTTFNNGLKEHNVFNLSQSKYGDYQRLIISGFTISLLDNLIFHPWEVARYSRINSNKLTLPSTFFKNFFLKKTYENNWSSRMKEFSVRKFYEKHYFGFSNGMYKKMFEWCPFLILQKYFRDNYQADGKKLSKSQIFYTSVSISACVSVLRAPFDVSHTLKQRKIDVKELFKGNVVRNVFRGWPASFFVLFCHNAASIYLLEELEK